MADFTNLATYARSLGWNPNLQPGRAKPTRTLPPVPAPPSAVTSIGKATTSLPALTRSAVPVDLNAEASKMVDARVQPLLDEIRSRIGAQAASGTQAIRGYTGELASQLEQQATTAGQPYRDAQVSQSASDAALAQRLTGQGSDLAQALSAKLAAAGDPGGLSASLPAAAAQTGVGSGNALYARGSASLADLIAREAAAKDYAGKMPGIARLSGLQQTGQLEGQLSSQLATETGKLTEKVPGLVQDAYGDLVSAQAKQDALVASREEERAKIAAGNARSAAATDAQNWRTVTTTQATNDRAVLAAQTAEARSKDATRRAETSATEATKRAIYAQDSQTYRDEIKAKAKANQPLKPGTKVGPYYIGTDGKEHLLPEYTTAGDGRTVIPRSKAKSSGGGGSSGGSGGGGSSTGGGALITPSRTITADLNAAGRPGLWGGTRSHPKPVIGADGKQLPVPKGYLTDTSPDGGSSSTDRKAAVQKIDTFLRDGSSKVTSLYDDNYGNPKLTRAEAKRQAEILVEGYLPNETPERRAAIVEERINRWYPQAAAKPKPKPKVAPVNTTTKTTETYKVGRTGIFVYDDPREAVGNNTPGVHHVRAIRPGDPDWADAVAKAIDPSTMKPATAKQRKYLLGLK